MMKFIVKLQSEILCINKMCSVSVEEVLQLVNLLIYYKKTGKMLPAL